MGRLIITIIGLLWFLLSCNNTVPTSKPDYVLVIHGGAGTILKKNMSPDKEKKYLAKLSEALTVGSDILKNGGSSIEAVTKTIMVMEDSPLFNAGKGAVFTANGENEMDASIMDGRVLNAGAVAGVKHIKNPILAARMVMEKTEHVLLVGQGAEEMAITKGLELVDSSYFFTESRWNSYLIAKDKFEKHGTVGAVALDQFGNLAAATSTGGMTYKMRGRVGDSPIIGAGTYADNNSCAVSATGHGEHFIRNVVAYDISALMKYNDLSLQQAADEVIMNKLKTQNAEGGIIAVDKNGNISMTFNTAGMYRGYITSEGESEVLIYKK
jgi:beta-aspartyl-peptidase (threonine type)